MMHSSIHRRVFFMCECICMPVVHNNSTYPTFDDYANDTVAFCLHLILNAVSFTILTWQNTVWNIVFYSGNNWNQTCSDIIFCVGVIVCFIRQSYYFTIKMYNIELFDFIQVGDRYWDLTPQRLGWFCLWELNLSHGSDRTKVKS